MIVIKRTVNSFIKYINEKSRQYVVTAASITTVLSILICLLFSGATLSDNIIYDGNVVAQVSEKAVYQNAFEKAEGMLVSDNAETVLTDAKIKPVLSFKEDNDNETELAKIILTNSAGVTDGYILKVDGKNTLYLDNNIDVNKALEERLNMYNLDNKTCENNFSSAIELTPAYLGDVSLSTKDEMSAYVGALDVVTVVTDVESKKIPYNTVVKKTSTKNAGYSKVTTNGVEGVKELSKKTTYLNGEKVEEDIFSDEVVKSPVSEVVVVGTASASTGIVTKYLSAGKLVYPADKNVGITVTAYWGDGRNHKGVDLAGPVGTKIFAALSGTVVEAKYAKDYGYYVLIDHGNGARTRYAHCHQLYAKAGDKVTVELSPYDLTKGRITWRAK